MHNWINSSHNDKWTEYTTQDWRYGVDKFEDEVNIDGRFNFKFVRQQFLWLRYEDLDSGKKIQAFNLISLS